MGTERVQGHMLTEQVPGHIWAPEGCPCTYGHQNGARINIGTGRVLGDLWKPEWSWSTYGHWKGACAHKYTLQMPGYLRAP